jgi:nucleoside 2-deoxyribosyltransferase
MKIKKLFTKFMETIYIAYRFTGVSKDQINQLITPVRKTLQNQGHKVFCNYIYDEMYIKEQYTLKDIMMHCYDNLNEQDVVLCLIDTDELSCGMLLELGYAFAKNKTIVVCARTNCDIGTVKDMVHTHFTYDNYQELEEIIKLYF